MTIGENRSPAFLPGFLTVFHSKFALSKIMGSKNTSAVFLAICVHQSAVAALAQGGTASNDAGFPMWIVAIAVIVVIAASVYAYFRFRSGAAAGNSSGQSSFLGGETENANSAGPVRDQSRNRPSSPPPTRSDLARAALDRGGNFSKDYAGSVDLSHLPIGQFEGVSAPRMYENLPVSDDDNLLDAIEELQDGSEADSDVRMIALRVMASFKSKNAVEALSQVALYDLSGTIRSKAVTILAEFDHESVFEAIVLSCADPSREVRAAGAKALFRVTFDRADEWARFANCEDQFLSRQVARATVEAGIAERSFDRLVLRDEKAAYEAFALVYLLIKTGETEKLFEAVREHRDLKTRIALLHSLKVANVAEVIPELSALIAAEPMSSAVADKAREALLGINALPVGT